jgi:5'-nucleotidase
MKKFFIVLAIVAALGVTSCRQKEVTPVPVVPAATLPPVVVPIVTGPVEAAPVRLDTHRVKWGDTLWDLSYVYYRDPWMFGKIAKANKIKNPDLIICGDILTLPAK